jgi:hypothetical protein
MELPGFPKWNWPQIDLEFDCGGSFMKAKTNCYWCISLTRECKWLGSKYRRHEESGRDRTSNISAQVYAVLLGQVFWNQEWIEKIDDTNVEEVALV